jgi:hypothetical protein
MTIWRSGEREKYPNLGMDMCVPHARVKSTSFVGDKVRVLGCRRQIGHGGVCGAAEIEAANIVVRNRRAVRALALRRYC